MGFMSGQRLKGVVPTTNEVLREPAWNVREMLAFQCAWPHRMHGGDRRLL
jgi:hypothetical protein